MIKYAAVKSFINYISLVIKISGNFFPLLILLGSLLPDDILFNF